MTPALTGAALRGALQERDRELRTRLLQDFPVSTQMGRPFAGADGVRRVVVGREGVIHGREEFNFLQVAIGAAR